MLRTSSLTGSKSNQISFCLLRQFSETSLEVPERQGSRIVTYMLPAIDAMHNRDRPHMHGLWNYIEACNWPRYLWWIFCKQA